MMRPSAGDPRVIRTENLTRRFGSFTAVADVSLTVGRGEIYGFLGLNGAGKTTTIRMLLGMIRPTAGSVQLADQPVLRGGRGPWQRVGCLVEVPYAYPELTVRENLEIFRRLRGLARDSVDRVLTELSLGAYAERRAGTLSLGNMQRLGLARALIHEPEILVLDEPSNGLDPAGIVEVREMLLNLARERGVTVFVSSHQLSEVARLATRIGIIHEGRLIAELGREELSRLRQKRLLVRTGRPEGALELLRSRGFSVDLNRENLLELTDARDLAEPDRVAAILVQSGEKLLALYEQEQDLESFFLERIRAHAAGPTRTGQAS